MTPPAPKPPRHLLSLSDWSADEVAAVLSLADDLKRKAMLGERPPLLAGKLLAQVYDKPSLRTRVSFEAAMTQLGGQFTFMSSREAGLLGRESRPDVSKVLTAFADAVVIRTFDQKLIEDVAAHAACPIVNGLSDDRHPCQALADALTIREAFGTLSGVKLVFVGDGNNVAKSLALVAARTGMAFTLCSPPAYAFDDAFRTEFKTVAPGLALTETHDLDAAVRDADVIYTDVWASMGQESEADGRKREFAAYQVNERVLSLAPARCRFLHCLPAHRGEEVTDGVMDGPQSLAFPQAENRMHLAKGLLAMLLT